MTTGLMAMAGMATVLSATFVALNLMLWVTLGPGLDAMQRYALIDVDAVFDNAVRLQAVDAERVVDGASPVAVVLGLSSAREGIDPPTFERGADARLSVLNLAWSGGSFRELAAYSEPLLAADLATPLVLVGVHAAWLAGRTRAQAWPGNAAPWRDGLEPWLWSLHHRTEIHSGLRALLLDLRLRIADAFDWPPRSRSPRVGADPWKVRYLYDDTRAPGAFWIAQERYWRSLGWFDPASYRPGSAEADEVRRLFGRLRARAPRRALVLLPESAAFRSQVPEAAPELLLTSALASDPDLRVLDLRDAVDDAGFRDHAHLNASGRRQLSVRLGRLAADLQAAGR